jgi:Secretion system C-terminal sorting domain
VSATQSGLGSTTFTGLSAGTYSILVTDANGCTATASITLTQPAPVVSNAGPNVSVNYGYQTVNCVTISGTQTGGVAPYVVRWNVGSATGTLVANTASVQVCPTVTTTYCYTVTDANGCTYTDCMTVCVTDIRCGQNLQKVTICHFPPGNVGNPQTICVGVPAVGQHVPAHGGDYLGVCGYSNPCNTTKTGDDAGSSAGSLEEEGDAMSLTAFPNPFSDATTIRFELGSNDKVTVQVFTMTGNLVSTLFDGEAESGIAYDLEFRPEGVSNGIYLAKVISAGGEVKVLKLVLNR